MGHLPLTKIEDLLRQAEIAVAFDQPGLSCKIVDNHVEITGTYSLRSADELVAAHGPLATYQIRVQMPSDFPRSEPILSELGNAFPHHHDRHVNADGSCCFGVWETIWLDRPAMTVAEFMAGPVHSYFFSQYYYDNEQEWPFGELPHGDEGIIKAYSAMLGCASNRRVVVGLLKVLSKKWKRDRKPCSCGSRKRLRNCCRPLLNAMPRRIGYRAAQVLLRRLCPADRG